MRWGLSFVGIALAVVGYFGPWIPHETAALTVPGSELSWFAKSFGLPLREFFVLPLVVAAVLFSLVAQRLVVRSLARLGVIAFGGLLVLASVPVYDSILASEYRGQLVLTAVGVVLVLLTGFSPRLSRHTWGALVVLLALGGIVPALWRFLTFRPRVAALYDDALGVGWGLVLCVTGFALLLVCGLLAVVISPPPAANPQ
jgi:hypothetical protein